MTTGMFENVIVGVDEHDGSRDAIALARNLSADGGRLTLANVHSPRTMPFGSSNPGIEAQGREHSLALLLAAGNKAGIEAEHVSVQSPSVGQGLHELAELRHADMLVLGSCRRGLIGRVLVNDDTHDALTGAACAVAVAPGGYAERADVVREIGVAYDGSPESRNALAVAREIAVARGAKLSAFQAISLPSYCFAPGGGVGDLIEVLVTEARDRIAALGDVEPHAAYGVPSEELTIYSASLDMLLIGSRGYGPIGRLIHGSTSQRLARTARCPLVVLPRSSPTENDSDRTEPVFAAPT